MQKFEYPRFISEAGQQIIEDACCLSNFSYSEMQSALDAFYSNRHRQVDKKLEDVERAGFEIIDITDENPHIPAGVRTRFEAIAHTRIAGSYAFRAATAQCYTRNKQEAKIIRHTNAQNASTVYKYLYDQLLAENDEQAASETAEMGLAVAMLTPGISHKTYWYGQLLRISPLYVSEILDSINVRSDKERTVLVKLSDIYS